MDVESVEVMTSAEFYSGDRTVLAETGVGT